MKKQLQKLSLGLGGAVGALQMAVGAAIAAPLIEADAIGGAGFFTDFSTLFSSAMTFVMALAALLVFAYLIWGGIDWITSGGDKGKTESARNKITAAVIGLIVIAASYAILTVVLNFLNINPDNVFDPSSTNTN